MRFKHAVPILYSSDVPKSLAYYTEVLGFENKWGWGDPPTFGGVSKNSVEIFFCEKGQGNPGTWLSVMVDNVDEYYEQAKAKGANIVSAPENMEWGLREMLVKDPDGHLIRFGASAPSTREKGPEAPEENFRLVHRKPSPVEYQLLIDAVGWSSTTNEDMRDTVIEAAVFSIVAEDNKGNSIGCALVISDQASFYYVKDVMIDPDWQGKGIGSAMMQEVIDWIDTNAPHKALVGLYTGYNLAPFYRQFGFNESFGMSYRVP